MTKTLATFSHASNSARGNVRERLLNSIWLKRYDKNEISKAEFCRYRPSIYCTERLCVGLFTDQVPIFLKSKYTLTSPSILAYLILGRSLPGVF